jgi:hypothetical protein
VRTNGGMVQSDLQSKRWGEDISTIRGHEPVMAVGHGPKAPIDKGFFYGSTSAKHARSTRVECGWLCHSDVVVKRQTSRVMRE